MHWSFSTLGCPEANFDQAMGLANDFGMNAIEFRTLENSMDLAGIFTNRFGCPQNAAIECDRLPVRICSLDTSCRMLGEETKTWPELLALAPWADALKVPYLRVFDGRTSSQMTDGQLNQARAFFAWWNDHRKANNWAVDVIIETHSTLTKTESILQLQEQLDIPAKLLWDSHHTWFKGGEDPLKTWAAIKDWVQHIHIKDSPMPTPHRTEVNYTLPGKGEFPFNRFLKQLRHDCFNGVISLEWEKQWHPELPELPVALSACRQANWW
jgi:sugar phosphate isomerase/epimerase